MVNSATSKRLPSSSTVRLELRLHLPVVWFAILLLAGLILPDRVWNTLLVGLGGLFVVAYIWARSLARGLHARRRLRFGWVSVGDRLEEQFEVYNSSPAPALWIEVIDYSNVPGYTAAVVRSVGEGGVDRWRQSAVCQRRGQFTLGPWLIRSSDPFGIFLVTRYYPTSNEIIIYPPIYQQLPIPLPVGQSSGDVRVQPRAWQATINAAAVRVYQPSDPKSWIHWPSSARREELLVRQFDLDAAGDIWLLLDLQAAIQLGQEAQSTEEHAVLLAASLAARALRHNRAVGLAAYGQIPQVLPPGRGQNQQWKMLRALALVNADGQVLLSTALRDLGRTAQRGTTAVIITPTHSSDWLPYLVALTRRGVHSNVILLDRPSFDGNGNSQGLCEAIHRLGFACHIIRRGELGRPLDEQMRRGFWEFRVTGTGKVITVQSPLSEGG